MKITAARVTDFSIEIETSNRVTLRVEMAEPCDIMAEIRKLSTLLSLSDDDEKDLIGLVMNAMFVTICTHFR